MHNIEQKEQQMHIIDIGTKISSSVDISVKNDEIKSFKFHPIVQCFDTILNFTLNESSQTEIDIRIICLEQININLNLNIHKHARVHIKVKCKCHNNDKIMCNIVQNHVGDYSESNVEATIVCDNSGGFHLSGKINIPREIQEVSASQYGTGLLLSETSNIHMSPFMQVSSKNVLCNHGFAIGGIDQEELIFFAMRGISHVLAKDIIANGLLE